MSRLLAYVQPRSFTAVLLLESLLGTAAARAGIEVVGVVDAAPSAPPSGATAWTRILAAVAVKRLFGAGQRAFFHLDMLGDARQVARRHGIQVLVPRRRDVNDPEHIAAVRDRLRPNHALSLGCLQIFGEELLASFESALNYHNGTLPDYRGLAVTAWSLYHREPETGYSFHRMDRGVDTGPVLLGGSIPVLPGASAMEIEHSKTVSAARDLPAAVERLVNGAAGDPQPPAGRYFSRAALHEVRRVDDISRLDVEEIIRRLEAFDLIWVADGRELLPVTAIERIERGTGAPPRTFDTSDGTAVVLSRCLYLPTGLFRLLRRSGLLAAALRDLPA
jgi:methionyl-tRNA formyltransferase